MFSFTWAAIGILTYFLFVTWRALKESEAKLVAQMCFKDEWLLLKTLIAIDYEAFKLELAEDGLPDKLKYPWVRMYYKLNKPEEFMGDMRENNSLFPISTASGLPIS